MGWTRHTGTVVSLAVLASVVANYSVHQHFERRLQRQAAVAGKETSFRGAMIIDADPMLTSAESHPAETPRYLDDLDMTRAEGAVLPALQTNESDDPTPASRAPHRVPVPSDAVPITDSPSNDQEPADALDSDAVRKVVEDELAGSSREERDIWYDELKSLPAGVVRDLLQVRKQLRALPRALHRMDPEPTSVHVSAPALRVAELAAEPVSQTRRQSLPDWVPTLNALEQASTIGRHNLANSTTHGYKRLRVALIDSYGTAWQGDDTTNDAEPAQPARLNPVQVEGCRLSEPLLDLDQGVLANTGRQLDLAIQGDGFFVALRNDKPVYTRCGAMVLDAQRRICLASVDGSPVVEPPITIPAETREIQISANGTVRVLLKQGADPVEVGQLVLARFASPSRLRPIGGTLLSPTEASGTAEPGGADDEGRGAIEQGFLEQSNVEPDVELAEIEQWQSLIKSLPAVNRPVTASGHEPRSR